MWATIMLFVLAAVFAVFAGGTGKTGVEHYSGIAGWDMYPDAVSTATVVTLNGVKAAAYKMMWTTVNPYAFNYAVCTLLGWICLILGLARVLKGLI